MTDHLPDTGTSPEAAVYAPAAGVPAGAPDTVISTTRVTPTAAPR